MMIPTVVYFDKNTNWSVLQELKLNEKYQRILLRVLSENKYENILETLTNLKPDVVIGDAEICNLAREYDPNVFSMNLDRFIDDTPGRFVFGQNNDYVGLGEGNSVFGSRGSGFWSDAKGAIDSLADIFNRFEGLESGSPGQTGWLSWVIRYVVVPLIIGEIITMENDSGMSNEDLQEYHQELIDERRQEERDAESEKAEGKEEEEGKTNDKEGYGIDDVKGQDFLLLIKELNDIAESDNLYRQIVSGNIEPDSEAELHELKAFLKVVDSENQQWQDLDFDHHEFPFLAFCIWLHTSGAASNKFDLFRYYAKSRGLPIDFIDRKGEASSLGNTDFVSGVSLGSEGVYLNFNINK